MIWSKIKTMAELTKKDIKEVFVEAIEPFVTSIQKDFEKLDAKIDLKADKLDNRLAKVEFELKETRHDIRSVNEDVKWMKGNSSELFAKLDKFIMLLEKNEQEILMLSAQLKRIEERVNKLESRQQ